MANPPLHGEFHLRLDDKARLTLPKGARAQIAASESSELVARGGRNSLEPAVWLFPNRHYEKLSAERADPDELGFDLGIFQLAIVSRLICDKRGRVTIPERLLRHYGILAPEVTLIGVKNHFELWSRRGWCEHRVERITRANIAQER